MGKDASRKRLQTENTQSNRAFEHPVQKEKEQNVLGWANVEDYPKRFIYVRSSHPPRRNCTIKKNEEN